MITERIKKLIQENPLSLATINEDGKPNVIGVACVKVVSENQFVITDNYMKQTKENILRDKNVCLAVWNKDWEGYKFVGEAEYYTEGKWKQFVEKDEDNEGMPAKGAILVTISEIIKLG